MKIVYSLANRYLIVLNSTLFLSYWVMMILYYTNLPDQIPMHFDLSGEVTRTADKSIGSWFLVPFIVTFSGIHTIFIFWAITAAGFESWNFPEKKRILSLAKEDQVYFRKVMKWFVKHILHTSILLMLILVMAVGIYSYNAATGNITFPLTLVLILITILYLVHITRQYFLIRNNFRNQLRLYHPES
jgi:uncharacterized membrane protein